MCIRDSLDLDHSHRQDHQLQRQSQLLDSLHLRCSLHHHRLRRQLHRHYRHLRYYRHHQDLSPALLLDLGHSHRQDHRLQRQSQLLDSLHLRCSLRLPQAKAKNLLSQKKKQAQALKKTE